LSGIADISRKEFHFVMQVKKQAAFIKLEAAIFTCGGIGLTRKGFLQT
jgi:hypothetical protein